MRHAELALLLDYTYAAHRRVLDAASQLSATEFTTAPPLQGARSLQQLLVHMLDAELGWRLALCGADVASLPELQPAHYPDVASVRAAWRDDERAMRCWFSTLDDDTVNAPAYEGRPLWQWVLHVVNHGTQHRSEAAQTLTHFGVSPGDLDFAFFFKHGFNDS
jgi:uncharacterized damage-inducible protein DinB